MEPLRIQLSIDLLGIRREVEPCALGFAELPDLCDERFAVLMGVHGVLVRQFAEFVGG